MKRKICFDRICLIRVILFALVAFGIVECLLGWEQLLGLKKSGHSFYPVTGTFYNPGPYCGFLAVIIPMALDSVLEKRNPALYWLSCAYLLISIPLLPALMGRTGWIAALFGSLYVVCALKRIPRVTFKHIVLSAIGFILLAGIFVYIKPSSALGRLLIWRNGLTAFKNNFLSGAGWDNVAGELGTAQEEYFTTHTDSVFASVAGSPEYAFNEFLQIGIAFGLLGLLAFILILVAAIINSFKGKEYGVTGSLIAFVTVCLSSYPLQFPEFIMTVAALVIIAFVSNDRISKMLSFSMGTALLFLAVYSCASLVERKRKSEDWNYMQYAYRYSVNEKDIKFLDSIASEQPWNNRLLFDYGKNLRNSGFYEKSNSVLSQGLRQSSDPMFLNLIGRNYQDMGNLRKAEEFYLRSANRLPGRLYPYYLLARMYADSASHDPIKFKRAYRTAMQLEPKIDSPAIQEMKRDLKRWNDSISCY